jgi:hypothetical protein
MAAVAAGVAAAIAEIVAIAVIAATAGNGFSSLAAASWYRSRFLLLRL